MPEEQDTSLLAPLDKALGIGPRKLSPKEALLNLCRNAWVLISAAALLALNVPENENRLVCYLIALASTAFVLTRPSSVRSWFWSLPTWLKEVGLASAGGVMLFFYINQGTSQWCTDMLASLGLVPQDIYQVELRISLVVMAVPAVTCLIAFFWNRLLPILADAFGDMGRTELLFLACLLVVCSTGVWLVYRQSYLFWTPPYYDALFTTDSCDMVTRGCYFVLSQGQNDLRQPLFAIFCTPFAAIPYLLGELIPALGPAPYIFVDIAQVALILLGFSLLARLFDYDETQRVCFVALASCTSTFLIFGLALEQYAVSFFWLTLAFWCSKKRRQDATFTLTAASGSMITSIVAVPLCEILWGNRSVKGVLLALGNVVSRLVVLGLIFLRFDLILTIPEQITLYLTFTGEGVPMAQRVVQFSAFAVECLTFPLSGATQGDYLMEWRQTPRESPAILGLVLFVAALGLSILNLKRKENVVLCAWMAFSVAMLLGLGWGTAENGLVLYSLYFGWPLMISLFGALTELANRMKVSWALPCFTAVLCVALLAINLPAFMQLMEFAVQNYAVA